MKQKLQSYNPKSNTYTEYFGPGKGLKWKTTKLQAEIEHIYWIFLPFSGVKMKNYKATSWNQTYILNIFALVIWWNEKLQNYNQKLNIYTGYCYKIPYLPTKLGKFGHSLEVSKIFTDFMMISLCFRTAYIKNTHSMVDAYSFILSS